MKMSADGAENTGFEALWVRGSRSHVRRQARMSYFYRRSRQHADEDKELCIHKLEVLSPWSTAYTETLNPQPDSLNPKPNPKP